MQGAHWQHAANGKKKKKNTFLHEKETLPRSVKVGKGSVHIGAAKDNQRISVPQKKN